jgi:hypothetical protein
MALAKPTLSNALLKTKEPEKPRREKIYNAKATPARQGKRGLTLYLDPVAHASLKAIAEERSATEDQDVRIKDLLEEAVNLVLQRYGKKPIA